MKGSTKFLLQVGGVHLGLSAVPIYMICSGWGDWWLTFIGVLTFFSITYQAVGAYDFYLWIRQHEKEELRRTRVGRDNSK